MNIVDANAAANAPPELLDKIFKLCERRHRFIPADGHMLFPNSRFHPFLLVCKKWHAVAERRLYTSISLGSSRVVRDRNGQKLELKSKDVCKRFCETVQDDARLASLVRELRMGCTSGEESEESAMHVRLIDICKHVEKIEIHGCHADRLGDLAAALAKADLVSVDLSNEQLGGYSVDGWMLTLSTVIRLIQRWPRLQRIYAHLARYESITGYEAPLADLPSVPGTSCPALTNIAVFESTFDVAQLRQLAGLCPALEELSITIGGGCNEVLQQCLEVWSSSLRNLVVFAPIPGDESVIRCPMTELRKLWMSSPLVTPSDMVFLPKLEELLFRGDYSQGADLVQVIRKGAMPNLRTIDANFSPPSKNDGSKEAARDDDLEIHLAEELRRVCDERNTFFEDKFTELEELEGYYGYPEEESPESSDNEWWQYENHDSAPADYDPALASALACCDSLADYDYDSDDDPLELILA